jgi:2-polyprenyl-3-methyl-5-hydroxy-6-metoxy-1,4-benzoquinol methylase
VKRIVQPELLDSLPPTDRRAIHSRRDLHRINGCMGNHDLMADALKKTLNGASPGQITELGAGDGNFLLSVAKKTSSHWPNTSVRLLDLQKSVTPETLAGFASVGWHAETVVADVFDDSPASAPDGVVITNLFLHHFEDARLAALLRLISQRAKIFIALEPRRAAWPLFCSRLLGAIGCNDVTRHDAVVSVRAGFSGQELSTLWPDNKNWRLSERRAGSFSHLFIARKIA